MLQLDAVAPAFTLIDVHGRERSEDELLSDGPIVLAFFKVSCPTCQLTLPFLERLHNQRQLIYGVSQDDAKTTLAFAERYDLTMPMLLDTSKQTYRVSNAFGITNVPSMFQIEKDRRISWASVGFVKNDLEQLGHILHVDIFHTDDDVPAHKYG